MQANTTEGQGKDSMSRLNSIAVIVMSCVAVLVLSAVVIAVIIYVKTTRKSQKTVNLDDDVM